MGTLTDDWLSQMSLRAYRLFFLQYHCLYAHLPTL